MGLKLFYWPQKRARWLHSQLGEYIIIQWVSQLRSFIDKNTMNEVGELVKHGLKLFGDLKSANLHEKAMLEQRLSRCCWRTNKFDEYVNGS